MSARRRLIRRSALYVPVNIERFVRKAYTRGADAVILDLEDSIPPNEKDSARTLVNDAIPLVAKGGADVLVRVNKRRDILVKDLNSSIWPDLTGILLPKVESVAEIHEADKVVTELERNRGMRPGIIQFGIAVETAKGVLNAYELACASKRIISITLGDEDLTRELGIELTKEGDELFFARSWIILVANAADIQPMGLVGANRFGWREPDLIYQAAIRSRRLGFKGASCVHPALISPMNRGFSPSPEEIDWARRAIRIFKVALKEGKASVGLEGRMVDLATVKKCREVIVRHKRIIDFEKRKKTILEASKTT